MLSPPAGILGLLFLLLGVEQQVESVLQLPVLLCKGPGKLWGGRLRLLGDLGEYKELPGGGELGTDRCSGRFE